MEDTYRKTSSVSNKPSSTKYTTISSSGRVIKRPRKIMTTSSDDASQRKRGTSRKIMSTELERLKGLADVILKKNKTNGNDRSKRTAENRALVNAKSYSKEEDDPSVVSNVSTCEKYSKKSSEDITPPSERSASGETIGDELERLKKLAGEIGMKNKVKVNDTSKRTENRATSNAKINFEADGDPLVCRNVSISKNSSQHNSNSTPLSFQCTKSSDVSVPTKNSGRTNAVNPKLPIDDGKSIEMDVQQGAVDISWNSRLDKIEKRLETIENQNDKLIKQNKQILDELSNKNSGEVAAEESLYQSLKGFPLSTVAEFKELDNVDSKEKRKKLYYHLLRLGGTKLRDFLHCALKETMRDDLVCQFTWGDQKGTAKFGNTRISNILYQAAKDCPLFHGPENKAQFKAEMQEVIRTTKQRHRNQKKKLTPTEPSDEEDEDYLHERINLLEEKIAGQSSHDNSDATEEEQLYDADSESQI